MGWAFTSIDRRKDLIAERSRPQSWTQEDGTRCWDVVLKSCYKGSAWKGTWYAVHERTHEFPDGRVEKERWIEVTLMQYINGWGYKDMEESMGPCEARCPISYLDMVPEPVCEPDCEACKQDRCSRNWARKWRARCRDYGARLKQRRLERKELMAGVWS